MPTVRSSILILNIVSLVALSQAFDLRPAFATSNRHHVDDLANKIQTRYESTTDLSADFAQTLRIEGFHTPMQSSGRVAIKKPGRLYWEYRTPQTEHIYVNGEHVAFYVPEHNQVIQSTLSQLSESRAPLHLLQGATRLREHFELELVTRDGRPGSGALQRLGLRPKGKEPEATSTRRIVIDIDPKTHYIQTLVMHEANGNMTTIHFSNITANSNLPDSLFQCDMPPDVEVIHGLP